MKHFLIFLTSILVSSQLVSAKMQVAVKGLESTDNKSLVSIVCKNTFTQKVKNARIWVFLMDKDGKVVGQKASWLQSAQSSESLLEPDSEQTFNIAVDTQSKAVKARYTFSKIQMEDGTLANPHKSVTVYKAGE